MDFLDSLHGATWMGAFTVALVLFVACDLPSSGPSFETETGVNSPVVVKKTFSLLGGKKSKHEPLIDTTTAQFDSLFTVGASDGSLSIEEEISSFEIGSLDRALAKATQGIGVDTTLSTAVFQGSDLATQDIEARFYQENSVLPPTPSEEATVPVADATIPFPPGLLAIPNSGRTDIQAESVTQATLTGETQYQGDPVNQVTFTLYNDPTHSTTLHDGDGDPPAITIRDQSGEEIGGESFDAPIGPGESETVRVAVEEETLGEDSEVVLGVEGNDSEDELTIALAPLRYQAVTVGGVEGVQISFSETNVSTQDGNGVHLAGVETRKGTVELDVVNNLSFPIAVDRLLLENNLQDSALPDSFRTFELSQSTPPISPGGREAIAVDVADTTGIASRIDLSVNGTLADSRDTVTLAATDNLEMSVTGSLSTDALYFWPKGERVQASSTVDLQQDRIRFDKSNDFVELEGGTLALNNLSGGPTPAFESIRARFPDIQRAPYESGDALAVEVPVGEGKEIDLRDVRLSPTDNVMDVHLEGTLETVSTPTAQNLRVVRYADEVSTDVAVADLDVRALEAGVTPFSVDVTDDANGDGRLDLSDLEEASKASFGGFDGISGRVDGLELTGSELAFRITTDVGTDAQLYAALQGRKGSSRTFLAGKGNKNKVSSSAPLGNDFYEGSSRIAREDLIQFGIEGAPGDDPVTRRITLTGENSTVDDFVSALPASLRFVARARLTGFDEGRIRLRRPLTFEAGLGVAIPVQIDNSFLVQDTIDANFSGLEDVTDPKKDVAVSAAELRVQYTNGIPLGADARFVVLDENENEVLSLPDGEEAVRLKPAPKGNDGTATGTQAGTASLDLGRQAVRDLAAGRHLHLLLTMDQAEEGGAATLRATDTIELSLEAKVEASVSVE